MFSISTQFSLSMYIHRGPKQWRNTRTCIIVYTEWQWYLNALKLQFFLIQIFWHFRQHIKLKVINSRAYHCKNWKIIQYDLLAFINLNVFKKIDTFTFKRYGAYESKNIGKHIVTFVEDEANSCTISEYYIEMSRLT